MIRTLFFLILISNTLQAQNPKLTVQKLITSKDYTTAKTKISDYLKTNVSDSEAIELLGDIYGLQEQWSSASEQYKKLVTSHPNNANYQYKFGGVMAMKALSVNKFKAIGIISDVKAAFNKAAELDENHIDVRWAMVELYMALPGIIGGSKKKSLQYANELQQISTLDGYLAKGYVYEYDDEPELAEKYFKLAASLSHTIDCNTQNAIQRNALYYQLGKLSADYKLQLTKGEKCLNIYVENYTAKDGVPKAWAYYRLAQIFKHKGDKENAILWIDKAIKGLPDIDVFQKFKQQLY